MLELVGDLATKKSDPVDLGSYLSSSVSNVICSLLMSVRFRHDDPKFIRFTSLIDDGFKLFTVTAAAGFIPLLKLLPGFNYAFNKIQQFKKKKKKKNIFTNFSFLFGAEIWKFENLSLL